MNKELSFREKYWSMMWNAWLNNKLKEPIEQLCTYDNMMSSHGHYDYFESFENEAELKRNLDIVYNHLPSMFADNLLKAYDIYLKNKDRIHNKEVSSCEEEKIFIEVDEFYYSFGERHIYSTLLDYALDIHKYIKR